jgi:malate synthase
MILNDKFELTAHGTTAQDSVLTPQALDLVGALSREFVPRVTQLLAARAARQKVLDDGALPEFPADSADIRESEWQVRDIPQDLSDQRVLLVGPAERTSIVNGLESGASVFVADFEDSLVPTWGNLIQGQVDLRDAVRRGVDRTQSATLVIRPRGWHLPEKYLLYDGEPAAAPLFDVGVYLANNAAELGESGSGPYFCLPKLESRHEARLWNDIFKFVEARGVVGAGAIRVFVLIESILAAFEMDEILYELRDYATGLACGPRDYVFSFIKAFRHRPEFVLPDRASVTMTSHFLRSWSRQLITTCHRRGAYALGGVSAWIPNSGDHDENDIALARVRADKERAVVDGHDGTWVAHPALVPVAREVFEQHMQGPNQLHRSGERAPIGAADLLYVFRGKITDRGFRANVRVALRYLAAWLGGRGCVAIDHLMINAATMEISRAQLWQWIHHETGILEDGTNITFELFRSLLDEELDEIRDSEGDAAFDAGHYREAAEFLDEISRAPDLVDFATVEAYRKLE